MKSTLLEKVLIGLCVTLLSIVIVFAVSMLQAVVMYYCWKLAHA